jgi:uncharacterized membrane-anchored protein YitT (DUF2179 family)
MDVFRKFEIIQMVIAFGYAFTAEEQPATRNAFLLGGLFCGLDVYAHIRFAAFEKPGWLWLLSNLPLFYIIIRKIGEPVVKHLLDHLNSPDIE